MTLDSDVARLARTHPFSLLPREAVQLVAFSADKHRLRAGDSLFSPGEIGEGSYFVLSGAILLKADGADLSDARRVGAGALIGESALYAPTPRRTEARAAEDALVMHVRRETLRRVLLEFPEAANKVRASVEARTRKLVDSLDAVRVKSLDGAATPGSLASR